MMSVIFLGSPVPPYTMPGQVQSVKGMDKVATALKAQFVVALGDNFYFEGVKNDMDPRFEKTFESVYSPDSLQVPWYVIAGNHGTFDMTYAHVSFLIFVTDFIECRSQRKRVCPNFSLLDFETLEFPRGVPLATLRVRGRCYPRRHSH